MVAARALVRRRRAGRVQVAAQHVAQTARGTRAAWRSGWSMSGSARSSPQPPRSRAAPRCSNSVSARRSSTVAQSRRGAPRGCCSLAVVVDEQRPAGEQPICQRLVGGGRSAKLEAPQRRGQLAAARGAPVDERARGAQRSSSSGSSRQSSSDAADPLASGTCNHGRARCDPGGRADAGSASSHRRRADAGGAGARRPGEDLLVALDADGRRRSPELSSRSSSGASGRAWARTRLSRPEFHALDSMTRPSTGASTWVRWRRSWRRAGARRSGRKEGGLETNRCVCPDGADDACSAS